MRKEKKTSIIFVLNEKSSIIDLIFARMSSDVMSDDVFTDDSREVAILPGNNHKDGIKMSGKSGNTNAKTSLTLDVKHHNSIADRNEHSIATTRHNYGNKDSQAILSQHETGDYIAREHLAMATKYQNDNIETRIHSTDRTGNLTGNMDASKHLSGNVDASRQHHFTRSFSSSSSISPNHGQKVNI